MRFHAPMKMTRGAARLMVVLCMVVTAIVQPAWAASHGGWGEATSVDAEQGPSVSIVLFETDLREALAELSLQTGVNIIPDETVQGFVTADLQDVPLEKALDTLLLGGGFAYRKIDEQTYFVGLPDPQSRTFGQLVETRFIRVKYLDAREALQAMPRFLSRYVQAVPERDLLTVAAPPSVIRQIEETVRRLDRPQAQIRIQLVVTDVSNSILREWGMDLFNLTASEGESYHADWEATLEYDGRSLGFASDFWGNLLARLRTLEKEQEVDIQADPEVIVTSGETAELFIGERRIMRMVVEDSDRVIEEDVRAGVALNVTPKLIGDDELLITIAPDISYIVGQIDDTVIVRENRVETTLRLRSGETVGIGSMTTQEDVSARRQVPLLGSIPLLGWLFKSAEREEADSKLLILLTAEVL